MCKYADELEEKNNVRESYGDSDTRDCNMDEDTPGEEIWNSLEGEGLTALVNIIRKYDYEPFLCGRRLTRHTTLLPSVRLSGHEDGRNAK